MASRLSQIQSLANEMLPMGTSRRKIVQILSVILIFEGLSVVMLFSYVATWIGIVSLFVGLITLMILQPSAGKKIEYQKSPGVRFIERITSLVGGRYHVAFAGASLIIVVIFYNQVYSVRPGLGDIDTITILFGVVLMLYPLLYDRIAEEMAFAIIFIGAVVVLLVLPQVVLSMSSDSGTSAVGNWYVHYMLAAPFAGTLDIMGIPAHSAGNLVTIQFQDGSVNTLAISAYCAGLYSFSIFLSAFIAFVVVFETLPRRHLVIVLMLGLLVAYVGNLMRMIIIGVVGYYKGIEALHWAHENVGWMIFLAWSLAFWWLILQYTSRIDRRSQTEAH